MRPARAAACDSVAGITFSASASAAISAASCRSTSVFGDSIVSVVTLTLLRVESFVDASPPFRAPLVDLHVAQRRELIAYPCDCRWAVFVDRFEFCGRGDLGVGDPRGFWLRGRGLPDRGFACFDNLPDVGESVGLFRGR